MSPRVSLPLQIGFFNGAVALYITPEVDLDSTSPALIAVAKQIAARFNSNFIPQNFAILPGSAAMDDIFVFTNFTQGNVLASAPDPAGPANTDPNYSPSWQVNLVTREIPDTGTGADIADRLTNAQTAGDVTIQKTNIIVECSVIFTLAPDCFQEPDPQDHSKQIRGRRRCRNFFPQPAGGYRKGDCPRRFAHSPHLVREALG